MAGVRVKKNPLSGLLNDIPDDSQPKSTKGAQNSQTYPSFVPPLLYPVILN